MNVLIKHFKPENVEEVRKFAKEKGLQEFNSLDFQFNTVPEGSYEIDTSCVFNNQYNTVGKNGHSGYRIFEYHERIKMGVGRQSSTLSGYGYYIAEGIEEIRAYQKDLKVCGYCGKQYYKNAPKWCNACLGSKYLTKDYLKLLYLVNVRDKWSFNYDSVKIPKSLLEKVRIRQKKQRMIDLKRDLKNEKARRKRDLDNAKKEYAGFKWLIKNDIDRDNCIFYTYTQIFCFGWRSALTEKERKDLTKKLKKFPFSYELK